MPELFIAADTDPYHASRTLAIVLSQGGLNAHCVLRVGQGALPNGPMVATRMALQVALLAGQLLSTQPTSGGDIVLTPFLVPDGSVHLLIHTLSLPAAVWSGQGRVIPFESASNPLVKAMEISSTLFGSSMPMEALYDASSALSMLQTIALARMDAIGTGQDVLLLPLSCDDASMTGASAGASNATVPDGVGHVKLVPATHVLASNQLAKLAALVERARQIHLSAGGMLASAAADMQQHQQHVPLAHVLPGHDMNSIFSGHEAFMPAESMPAVSRSAAAAAAVQQAHQHVGIASTVMQQHPSPAIQQQRSTSAAQATAPGVKQPQRNRKADYVIVTEDTSIKNAAGAIAKVLSRVCDQGVCCPVFTERKTGQPSGVVSVAVKAIAVARGYVANEGGDHQVAFQPYVRSAVSASVDPMFERRSIGAYSSDGTPLQGLAMADKPTAPPLGRNGFASFSTPTGYGGSTAVSSDSTSGLMPDGMPKLLKVGLNPRYALIWFTKLCKFNLSTILARIWHFHARDMLTLPSGLELQSFENCCVDPNHGSLTDSASELGFDVFKVPTHVLPSLEESALPVKVG